jgi:hypothetical protein
VLLDDRPRAGHRHELEPQSWGTEELGNWGTKELVRSLLFAACLTAAGASSAAADVTFTRDVAPILHAKCASCHRPGEAAPMPLLTFAEARPFARAIRDRVITRRMPPWPADRAIGRFSNDPSLTAEEIATIVQWAEAGAPQGDPAHMPAPPEFSEGWQLGEPDLIVELPEIQIPAAGRDLFPIPAVTVDLPEDRWIRAVEVRPTNRQVAHHAVLFAGGNGLLQTTDPANVLAVWAVGTPPTAYPDGTGRWLRKNQVIAANLHYHPNGTATSDRMRVGFYFGKGELAKEVSTAVAGNVTFEIPPHEANHELRSVYVADQDISIISFFPHMHLRGKEMRMTATFPDGRRQVLLNVPAYDFNWQLFYYPKERITLPRGTRVDVVARYDNSAGNSANPNPSRRVRFGETSNDEMMFGTFEFVPVEGVSPARPDDAMRMQVVAKDLPADSSYLLSIPFLFRQMPSALYLPRTGEGTWYLAVRPGIVIDVPAREITWNGNAFSFLSDIRAGALGGRVTVSGEVDDKGAIRGQVTSVGGRPSPLGKFTGTRRP